MGNLVAVLGENLKNQPWELPAWKGDIRPYGEEMILKVKQAGRDTLPTEPLHIWEYPIAKYEYLVAIDPSSGMHQGDPAAIQITRGGGLQVAEMLIEKRSPEEQLRIAVWLCEFYNEATLAVEVNGGPGAYIMQRLTESDIYRNLWRDMYTGLSGYFNRKDVREKSIAWLQESLKNGYQMMRSLRMREQLEAFESNGPADDDLVHTFLIAHYCMYNRFYTAWK